MTPLNDEHTVLDWMLALRLPLVLVTGSYLGTISHTLTALDTLLRRELSVLTIVVNETEGSSVPLDETVAAIRRFAHPLDVLPVPRTTGGTAEDNSFAQIFGGDGHGAVG
jgi:dethiobiotin synthetase